MRLPYRSNLWLVTIKKIVARNKNKYFEKLFNGIGGVQIRKLRRDLSIPSSNKLNNQECQNY